MNAFLITLYFLQNIRYSTKSCFPKNAILTISSKGKKGWHKFHNASMKKRFTAGTKTTRKKKKFNNEGERNVSVLFVGVNS